MMNTNILKLSAAVIALMLAAGCQEREWTYDNKLFISGEHVTSTLLKASVSSSEEILTVSLARPEDRDLDITYSVEPSLVDTYNKAYYDEAVILPEANYSFSSMQTRLYHGTVESEPVTITFTGLDQLPLTRTYVLPVTVSHADIDILPSARTSYYVFRGGAIINVVADMEKSNYIEFESFESGAESTAPFRAITDFTVEALINVREFLPGIQSVIGMEGRLLIRISDNGLEPNQLQVVTPSGNVPAKGVGPEVCALTPGEWIHVAATGNAATGEVTVYFNGEETYSKTVSPWGSIDLVTPGTSDRGNQYFHIGYSYASGRELDGMISECRIWNLVRTQEEISLNQYEVDPASTGLIGYWKFDEGQGSTITDYTAYGNNGKAKDANLLWVPVSLPETE